MPILRYPETDEQWLQWRSEVITSTEVAALFGESPYCTAFELHHRKKNREIVMIDDNERMKWGRRFEEPIARGVAEDYGWKIRKLSAFALHDKQQGLGASFDFEIIGHDDGPGILEVKNVDGIAYRQKWSEDEDDTSAPAHIEIQLQAQLEVMDRDWGAIVAMVGGNTPKVIMRRRDREVGAAILKRVAAFWRGVENNQTPRPDLPTDAEFMCKLYGFAEPGKLLDARDNSVITTLCQEYRAAGDDEKAAADRKATAKARLLELIGDAEKVLVDGYTISAGIVGEAQISFTRAAYRNFRLTQKKPAKAKEAA